MSLSEVADLYIILRAVTAPFSEAMGKAGAEGAAASGKISGGFAKAAPIMVGLTAATGLAIGMTVKWASDFETQYTRLYTAAGASKTQVLANRDAMLALGTATGYTGTQIAEAMYHPISAGYAMADALKMTSLAAQEARISGASLDDTTYALSSVMRAFGQTGKDATGTMAMLNAIVGDGDMHFQDFNTSIKNWAPTAAAMKIPIQAIGAGLAYLTDRGNSADEASTRLTMGLTLMATPSAQAAKMLEGLGVASGDVTAGTAAMTKTLKAAHITQNDLALDLQKPDGVYVALTHLKNAMDAAKISGTEADSVFSKIFGGGRSDKAILSLMSNLDQLKAKNDQIGADATAQKFAQDWADTQKTTAVQFEKLKAQIINLGIGLGEKLLPPLKKVMGYITDGIGWITKHKEAMIALAGVLSGVVVGGLYAMASAVVAVVIAAGPITAIVAAISLAAVEIVTHWSTVKKWFNEFYDWFQRQSLVVKEAIIVMLGPIAWFAAAAYEVYKHWDQIWAFFKQLGKDFSQWGKDTAKFFEHMWDNVSKFAETAWKEVVKVSKGVWKDLETAWNDTVHFLERIWNDTGGKLVHTVASAWDDVSAAVSKKWKHISDDLSSIWGSLTTIWDKTGGKLVHYISEGFDWVSKEIHKHWDGIKGYFTMVWNYIYGTVRGFLQVITGFMKASWEMLKGVTKMAWDLISGVIKGAWDTIYGLVVGGLDIVQGIWQAGWDLVKGIIKTAWDLITGVFNTALDLMKDSFKLFADLFSGKWGKLWDDFKKLVSDAWNNIYKLVQGFLSNVLTTVLKGVKDVWDGFIKGAGNALDGIGKGLADVWNAIVKFFKDAATWLIQAGKDIIKGLIDGIKSMGKAAVEAVKGVGNDIVSGFKSLASMAFGSPSRTFHKFGQDIGQGLINGIMSMHAGVGDAVAGMGDVASSAFGADIGGGGSSGSFHVTPQGAAAPGVINIYVQGSVLTDLDLRDVVQEQMLRLGARYSTSYTPYKR